MSGARVRVSVKNAADGGYLYWLAKLYAFSLFVLGALALVGGVTVYGAVSRAAPALPDLSRYASIAPGVTRFYAWDGSLLGEFAKEWREVVPYEKIPKQLVDAFLAAEDHAFFSHGGLYLRGIARAAWRNITAGDWAQGGSTITQQVAKQFLGNEKTLARKAKEAIVARRLEARYTKEEILAVYLNHIFLGSGAYGVQAAAKRYYSRNVWELDLGQMAVIAGLAQAPSRDSPLANPENARRRRDAVLDKMARHGFISAEEAETWKATPIAPTPYRDVFLTTQPYFAEHVRRYVKKKYGDDGLMKAGLRVETTVVPFLDGLAYDNVDWNVRKQDKRQGWRGPEAHLAGTARATFLERAAAKYGDGPLEEGRRYLALVEEVKPSGAKVRVGARTCELPIERMSWAVRWSRTNYANDQTITSARSALNVGDVVWVSRPPRRIRKFSDWTITYGDDGKPDAEWMPEKEVAVPDDVVQLEQTPHVQGALYTFDLQTGYVLAMVGGQDYARSEYNRAVQACRQPGSTYKPIYYALALDQGLPFDHQLSDVPKGEVDPMTGEVWTPTDLFGGTQVQVSLEYALVWSKNVPSVELFKQLGGPAVEAWARRLGFTSPIIADKALALGASCTYLDELSRAFAIFARNGRWLDLVYVRRVLDRDGRILEDQTVPYDPALAPGERLDRLVATAGTAPKQAIPARAAFLVTKLLRNVVAQGHMRMVRQQGIVAAGKTGTSSATMDTWFVGFTDRWLTTAWLGDDLRERPLGLRDAAYLTTVPFWARYMHQALDGMPMGEIPTEVPPGVKKNDRGGPLPPGKRASSDEASAPGG